MSNTVTIDPEKLRAIRTEGGWNQSRLASACMISRSYLSELESGKKTQPSRLVAYTLAENLGVPLSAFTT